MKIDLEAGFGFEVSGEIAKFHTLPVDFLIQVRINFRGLVNTLAKHTISESESIDLNNFKIHLSGFKRHSAVPVFIYEKNPQGVIGNVWNNVKPYQAS